MSKAFLPTILKQKEQEVAAMSYEELQPLRSTYSLYDILASSIATVVIVNYFGNKGSSVALATAIMTILILIFGEITPKLMAKNNNAKIADRKRHV